MAIYLNNKRVDTDQHFPDGTFAFKVDRPNRAPGPSDVIRWHYESEAELVALYYVVSHLRASGIQHIKLELPYIPNARMDRVQKREDVFTLKYFCELINAMKFDSVCVLDPHSSVATALLNNVVVSTPEEIIWNVIREINDPNLGMFYPDEGSMKRYSCLIKKPYGFGIKKRDWTTGKILGLKVIGEEGLRGKNVLIVDDICSRGGTFYHSALALKEAGVKDIYLYVTHCENALFEGKLLHGDLIKHIYTTNSIFTSEHDKISVLRLKGGE